jgi:phosphatidylserine/phosphatidylglycerophosphate/cardiolipin synthase-like enzyme
MKTPSMSKSFARFAILLALASGACADQKDPLPAARADAGVDEPIDGAAPPEDDAGDTADAGDDATSAGVKIIVEPGDDGAALLAAINGAKTSVHMTMYLMTSDEIIAALIAASKRPGMDVKVVLNKTFPTNTALNADAFKRLKDGGVNVVDAPPAFSFTHAKCVIIDAKEAWVMTMNTTQTAPSKNREFLAIDPDPADVAEAEQIFAGDFTNTAIPFAGKLVVAPNNALPRLLTLIRDATTSLDVEGEEFSDGSIRDALIAAAKAGIKVRLVVPSAAGTPQQTEAIKAVKAAGVAVVGTATPYIHAKAIVVDGARAYVGSINFSTGSLVNNREIGVVFGGATEVAKVSAAIATDFAAGAPL